MVDEYRRVVSTLDDQNLQFHRHCLWEDEIPEVVIRNDIENNFKEQIHKEFMKMVFLVKNLHRMLSASRIFPVVLI